MTVRSRSLPSRFSSKRQVQCWHFQHGHCKLGPFCRFLHGREKVRYVEKPPVMMELEVVPGYVDFAPLLARLAEAKPCPSPSWAFVPRLRLPPKEIPEISTHNRLITIR